MKSLHVIASYQLVVNSPLLLLTVLAGQKSHQKMTECLLYLALEDISELLDNNMLNTSYLVTKSYYKINTSVL